MLSVFELVKLYATSGHDTVGGGVRGISFDIKEGEFFTLLGPSGCGKTTALRSVAGLEDPSAGRIAIDGRAVFDQSNGVNLPASERGIGMVFQSYAVWPHMTVGQNVAFPLEMDKRRRLSKREIAKRVDSILNTVGLEQFSSRSAHQLSGGQQQRLSLARALASEPKLLLLDEPLSNLDALLRDQMRIELRRLQKVTGVATLYVTHDQSEALAMSDRIAIMRNGVIEQVGNPSKIYHAPVNRFVASFIGRMNIYDTQSAASNNEGLRAMTSVGEILASSRGSSTMPPSAVAIRPEHVVLSRSAEGPLENQFSGTVDAAVFCGEITEYQIRLQSGAVVSARRPSLDPIPVNADVTARFPAEHVIQLR